MRAHRSDDNGDKAFLDRLFDDCSEMMKAIVSHLRPVTSAVDGVATARPGASLSLVTTSPSVSDRAQFCTPGVNLGDFCSTPVVALSCNVAPKHAMETLLTGETVDARTARDIVLACQQGRVT